MTIYKVAWEELRYAGITAKSPEEAEELARNGEFDEEDVYSEKVTVQPKVVDILG